MNIAVLLSGCGVYDGTEIHEAVLTLLAIAQQGAKAVCVAPNYDQHHVINHLTGKEMSEKRNVLVESARIARGEIQDVSQVDTSSLDALMLPGGFGTAKNFTKWAFQGEKGEIQPVIKTFIQHFVKEKKPIGAVCMSPTTVAKALEGTGIRPTLTVGNTGESSPYDIKSISEGMERIGVNVVMCPKIGLIVDKENNIVTSPCYMLEASIVEVYEGIRKTVAELIALRKNKN
ncbi:MAG: isoprenoid biosynthesis glyoxalase ElbB [Flammeovirgaceae bacterium]|nr:isoprenoid biosynthesis glyoxalase ElbB [Flammeovirgaceae bacterium]MDW8287481.1 isoprenoid biosynthesis glyoxalase ElbB [Flammeovirgaceae bacterium]